MAVKWGQADSAVQARAKPCRVRGIISTWKVWKVTFRSLFQEPNETVEIQCKKAVWSLSLSLVQFLKVPEVRGSPVSRVLQERWPKLCLSSARPQMSFVSANALKSVEFRRQQYGPLTNTINSVSAGPRAWDTLAAIWSL